MIELDLDVTISDVDVFVLLSDWSISEVYPFPDWDSARYLNLYKRGRTLIVTYAMLYYTYSI